MEAARALLPGCMVQEPQRETGGRRPQGWASDCLGCAIICLNQI
jgi:hypothetical protein